MRKFLIGILFLVAGCSSVPPEAYTLLNDNSIVSDAFLVKMQKGETTREQEQAFIRANRRAWHSENFAFNNAPLPTDMLVPGNTGPLDNGLLQALSNDLNVLKSIQDLNKTLNGISNINSNTGSK